MKLKTHMTAVCGATGMYPVVNNESPSTRPLSHDAACAHALMQAIGEIEPACAIYELHERADEIMASWGFDSGEVE